MCPRLVPRRVRGQHAGGPTESRRSSPWPDVRRGPRIATADQNSKAGRWEVDPSVLGFDLAGKTLGLVGFGRIAGASQRWPARFAWRCGFSIPMSPRRRSRRRVLSPVLSLAELLAGAQVPVAARPLNAATRRLIGAEQHRVLPRGAVLINTARGRWSTRAAVLAALASGQLAGAGLDVWESEPVSPEHPLLRHPGSSPRRISPTTPMRRCAAATWRRPARAQRRCGEPPATLARPGHVVAAAAVAGPPPCSQPLRLLLPQCRTKIGGHHLI